jgi:hypothetical protein
MAALSLQAPAVKKTSSIETSPSELAPAIAIEMKEKKTEIH